MEWAATFSKKMHKLLDGHVYNILPNFITEKWEAFDAIDAKNPTAFRKADAAELIQFDGKRWRVTNRATHPENGAFEFGYVSKGAEMPQNVPLLRAEDQRIAEEILHHNSSKGLRSNYTSIATPILHGSGKNDVLIPIEKLLPRTQYLEMVEAHKAGKPIRFIRSYTEKNNITLPTNWVKDDVAIKAMLEKQVGKQTLPITGFSTPAHSDTTTPFAEILENGHTAMEGSPQWVRRISEFAQENKTPLIFASAAIAIGAISYGMHRQQEKMKRETAGQHTRSI